MNKRIVSSFVIATMCFPLFFNSNSSQAATLKLNKTKVTIKVGKSVVLKVKGSKKKVKWSSSNKNIASVSSKGKVVGKASGKTIITAIVSKKKLKCKVTVKNTKPNPDEEYLKKQQLFFDQIAKLTYSHGQVNDKDPDLGIQYGYTSEMDVSHFQSSGELITAYSYLIISYCPKYDFIDLMCRTDFSSPDFDTDNDMIHAVTVRLFGNQPYNCRIGQFYFDTAADGTRINSEFGIDDILRNRIQDLNVLTWTVNSQFDNDINSAANRLANSGLNTWYRDMNAFLYETTNYTLSDLGFGM